MAIPAYLWLIDDKGQPIHGDTHVKGREGSIEVLAASHEVAIPTDRDTGAVTATRKHGAFLLTKAVDASSAYLYKACCTGQTLHSAILKWYQIATTGQEQEYYRHTLESVKIMRVQHLMYDIKQAQYDQHPHLEQVELRYAAITWNYLKGNISHADSWEKRR